MSCRPYNRVRKFIPRTEAFSTGMDDAAHASVDQPFNSDCEIVGIGWAAALIIDDAKLGHLKTEFENSFDEIMPVGAIDPGCPDDQASGAFGQCFLLAP